MVVRGEFGVFGLANQFWSHPLDLFLNVRRIGEGAFVDEKWFHPIDRFLESFLGKTAARVAVVPEFTLGISAEGDCA